MKSKMFEKNYYNYDFKVINLQRLTKQEQRK